MFKKYTSLENHDNLKNLRYWDEYHREELEEVQFEITEKLHGANFSILVDKDGKVTFAKRTAVLNEDDKFFDFQSVFNRDPYLHLIKELQNIVVEKNASIQLIGELFGKGVQKEVYYGEEKFFRWFNLKIDNKYIAPKEADDILEKLLPFKVPTIGFAKIEKDQPFKEFISSINSIFNSKLGGIEETNLCEGVVIKPYEKMIVNRGGHSFLLIKKKNEKFKEKTNRKPKKEVILSEGVKELLPIAESYINDNRMHNVFSKEGLFEDRKEISKYAASFFEDFEEDFMKDHKEEFDLLEKKDQKLIKKSVGTKIFKFLNEFLKNQI
jgi:Rnl2 family RNA ligase